MPTELTRTPFTLGVHGLSSALLRALTTAIPALYAVPDAGRLPGLFTDVLARLIPADAHGVVVRNESDGERRCHLNPVSARHESLLPAFFAHFADYAPAAYRNETGTGEALALSDFLSVAELESRAIYHEYYRPLGLEDDLTIKVKLDGVVICAGALRRRRGFEAEERELMNALRPHFKQAWSNALLVARLIDRGRATARVFLPEMLERAFNLTPREAEVLYWVAQGKTNPEAADILRIRPYTVRTHLERIFAKLGVNSRHAATLRALETLGMPAQEQAPRLG